MSLTIEQLRAAFKKPEKEQRRQSNYYPFWNMNFDESARVRFLPDKNTENPKLFLIEKLMHNLTINGEDHSVPCLKMYDKREDCPICNVSSAFYKEEGENSVNGKKYWRKRQHIGQVLVLDDPLPPDPETGENSEGKIKFLNIGFQLYTAIEEAIASDELDELPFDYHNGYDFIIKKTKQGKNAKYDVGSRFARRPSSLTEDEIAYVEENIVDLSTLIPARPSIEKIESMLEAALTGREYHEEDEPVKEDVQSTKEVHRVVVDRDDETEVKNVSASVQSDVDTSDDSDDIEEAHENILEMLRKRGAQEID